MGGHACAGAGAGVPSSPLLDSMGNDKPFGALYVAALVATACWGLGLVASR